LSDLAVSCEYLTIEKSCSAVSESEKAKAARQLRCVNDEKDSCCYICMSKSRCAINCNYLGKTPNETQQVAAEKPEVDSSTITDKKTKANNLKEATDTFCPSCNVKMSQTRTTFRIEGWDDLRQKLADDDSVEFKEESLPVIVCMCPKCGKIEFKADEPLNKN
jgi:hypothetical protein